MPGCYHSLIPGKREPAQEVFVKENISQNLTSESQSGKLGTFAGVFTPSVLTILGIILFLRLGYVVGNAGLGRALIMIGLANTISVLTSISLAAISTNLKVKGGGDYYLISRILGVEFGGAIGIVLFLAQSVSIAFYCMGFGEAMTEILPDLQWLSTRMIAEVAVLLLFILAWLGADWATRFQYGVMLLIGLALVSFFWGGFSGGMPLFFLRTGQTPLQTFPSGSCLPFFSPRLLGLHKGLACPEISKIPERASLWAPLWRWNLNPGLFRGCRGICGRAASEHPGGGLRRHGQGCPVFLSH